MAFSKPSWYGIFKLILFLFFQKCIRLFNLKAMTLWMSIILFLLLNIDFKYWNFTGLSLFCIKWYKCLFKPVLNVVSQAYITYNWFSKVYLFFLFDYFNLPEVCLSDKNGFHFSVNQKYLKDLKYFYIVFRLIIELNLERVDKIYRL